MGQKITTKFKTLRSLVQYTMILVVMITTNLYLQYDVNKLCLNSFYLLIRKAINYFPYFQQEDPWQPRCQINVTWLENVSRDKKCLAPIQTILQYIVIDIKCSTRWTAHPCLLRPLSSDEDTSDRLNIRFSRTSTMWFGPNDKTFFCRTQNLFCITFNVNDILAYFCLLNDPHVHGVIIGLQVKQPKECQNWN